MSTAELIEKVQGYVGRFAFWHGNAPIRRKKGNAVRKIASTSLSNLSPEKKKELEFLCNKLFQKQELIASGRLQLLGLSKVKQRVGRRWSGLQRVIYEICDETIQKYMARGDISIRYRDDSYILLFTSCSMAESALKANIIAREIRDRLFAEEDMQDIEILQQTASISASAVNSNAPFPDSLNSAFESSYKAQQESSGSPAARADISMLRRVDVDAFGDRKAVPPAPEYETESLPFRAVHYLPVWDQFKKGLVAHMCLAFDSEADLSPLNVHLDFYARKSPSEIANMDLAILGSIISWMKSNPGSFENFGIICPVHYDTIDRIEGKGKYRALCQKIDAQMKPYILFMVLDVPLKMPWLSLNHVVSPLKTYGRVLCGHLPLLNAEIDFKSLRMAGFDNVGVILNNLSKNDVEFQKKTLIQIKSFIARAKKSLITQTFVLGIDDNALATAVAASGVRYMGGEAIHSCISTPLEKINFENAGHFTDAARMS